MMGKSRALTVPGKAGQREVDGLSFEAELSARSYRSERNAWIVASLACVIATLAVTGLVLVQPLKQTIPYYIFVDKPTGAVQAVIVNDAASISANEAVARYWISRYTSARERYVYRLQQEDYNFVMATSEQPVGRAYSAQFEGPAAKTEVLRDSVEERITILSAQVTPGTTGRGTVRYQITTWRQGQREPEKVETFVADLAYDWVNVRGWSSRDLLTNPMGFRVTAYRSTQELVQR